LDIATHPTPLFLDRERLAQLMRLEDYLAAVEGAFRAYAAGRAQMPMPLHIDVAEGTFHAKAASVRLEREWAAVKVNANFPGNPAKGLPTIQGAVLLFDASNGRLLAILDSMEITSRRTAAASALAAMYLARPDAKTVAICGCGEQGRAHLAAIAAVRRLERMFAWDLNPGNSSAMLAYARELGIETSVATNLRDATLASDIIVTTTSSRSPFLTRDCVRPGTFIAAVGADNPHKSELHPDLFTGTTVVVDTLDQAAAMGDLHHAIDAGTATRDSIHAELAQVVVGERRGRATPEEITIFDSTGLAIQDVAAAAAAYRASNQLTASSRESFQRANSK
jgi:ornithine cyclodeaminase/alanine dehydrogenase-like protein (mu-crystallin family)